MEGQLVSDGIEKKLASVAAWVEAGLEPARHGLHVSERASS